MNVNVNVNFASAKTPQSKQERQPNEATGPPPRLRLPTYLYRSAAPRAAWPARVGPPAADGQTPASTRHTPSVFPFSASKDRTPDLHVLLRRMPPPHLARACPRRPHPRPRPLPSLGSAHCILYRLARAYGLVHGQAVHPVQA